MGRRKQRAKNSESETVKASWLEHAWPSAPTRNPRYVLYCTNHENDRQYIVNSYGRYAIRKIFDALVGDNEIEPSPLDPDRTMTFGDIDIKSDQMDEILAHVYTPAEEAWELPIPYPGDIQAFLTGGRIGRSLGNEASSDAPKREKAPPKEKRPAIDRSKFITVQKICEDIKMDPREARAALRKAKIEKPIGGWLGDEKWAASITVILKKAQIELKKKEKK